MQLSKVMQSLIAAGVLIDPNLAARDHALLGASGHKKWGTCTPSARLEEFFPDEQSEYAKEGSMAHTMAELALRHHYFNEAIPEELNTVEKRRAAGYTDEMVSCAATFLAECRKISDPLDEAGITYTVMVEQRLDYSPWVPQGFGTGDFVLVCNTKAWVKDFKYGQGVEIDAEDNGQMNWYGLGAHNELSFAYEGIQELDVGIVQPRINNFSSSCVSLADLLAWGEQQKPIAEKAWAGEGELVPGPHCTDGFCKARFTCKARIDYIQSAAGKLADANTLIVDEIAELIPKLDEVEKWAKGMKTYTLSQAVDGGVAWPGYKLVEGRSNRFLSDTSLAAVRLVANGVDKAALFPEPNMVGITKIEELVGSKKKFDELLGDLIRKPAGKPTLVPVGDKRPEWKPKASADDDFGE